jgi:transposase-like protein
MDAHENARTTPHSRMLIVSRLAQGQSVAQVAVSLGTTPRTVRKWRDRHAAEGQAGLRDRSSRPHHSPTRQAAEVTASIETLRRQRRSGPAIARQLGLASSTVGLTLRRIGLNRLAALEPKPAIIRYEREHPGELIHIDIKKLGRIDGIGHRITGDRTGQSNKRGTGWEYLHVAVDDASRLAFTAMLPDERKESAVAFLDGTHSRRAAYRTCAGPALDLTGVLWSAGKGRQRGARWRSSPVWSAAGGGGMRRSCGSWLS